MTFHWPLEFPEVIVEQGGFDAFVGNPPFMAGTSISTVSGKAYAAYLKEVTPEAGNRADLAVYFLRRAYFLVRHRGNVGFVATNSIAEADSRQGSFSYVLREGGAVYWALPNFKWPGSASLTVSTFAVTKGDWAGACWLNDRSVEAITSFLDSGDEATEPHHLAQPIQGFTGSKVYGDGFIISRSEGNGLLARTRAATKVVRPYWDGDQFNESPTLETERFIVNFFDMSEDEARNFPEPFTLVEARVKPGRMNAPEQGMKDRWWQFQRIRKELYVAVEGLSQVLMRSIVSKHHVFGFVDPTATFSHAVVVIATEDNSVFGLLQSSLHECWAVKYGSKHETRSRYTISDCFHTFPFPESFAIAEYLRRLDAASSSCLKHRNRVMKETGKGLTKTYNRFHDTEESCGDIKTLRQLHVELDVAVAAAYGWTDLDLGHGFHETKQGVRYTISEPARREVLARLLKLNHERYAEEVKQGLHEKKKPKGKNERKATTGAVPSLFQDEEEDE